MTLCFAFLVLKFIIKLHFPTNVPVSKARQDPNGICPNTLPIVTADSWKSKRYENGGLFSNDLR